jgi:large repetitive protein
MARKFNFWLSLVLFFSIIFPSSVIYAAELQKPGTITATETTPGTIRLDWNAISGIYVYHVFKIVNGNLELISEVDTNRAFIKNLPEGRYEFAVTSVVGSQESALSDLVSSTITYPEMQSPLNLRMNITNGNDVNLFWDNTTYTQVYRVYQINNGERKLVQTTKDLNISFPNQKEGIYNYEVTSFNNLLGESKVGSHIDVNVKYPAIQPPTGVSSLIRNETDIYLKWTASEYATSYNIYEINSGKRTLIQSTEGTTIPFRNKPEGTYTYEVTSFSDRFGESGTSSRIEVNLLYPKMEPPANVTTSIASLTDIVLNWSSVNFATGYNIYKVTNEGRELITTTDQLTYTFEKMLEGNYIFEITSVSNRFGESKVASRTEVLLVYPKILPPANTQFVIVNGNDVTLSWTGAKYANEYLVYQVKDGTRTLVAKPKITNITFFNQLEGTYKYEITTNSSRIGESKTASPLEVTIVHPKMISPPNLTSQILNGKDLSIKWKTVEFATGYKIYQLIGDQKKLIKTTSSLGEVFPNHAEGLFVYEVFSYSDRFGESDPSRAIVKVNYPGLMAPVATLEIQNRNNALLTWEKTLFTEKYNVYELINGEAKFLNTVSNNSTYLSELTEGTHEYVVTSYSRYFGESPLSNIVSAEIKPKLEAPTTSVPTIEGNDVTLSWNKVPGAGSYNVYEEVDGKLIFKGNTNDTNLKVEDISSTDHEYRIVPVSPEGVEGEEYSTVVIEAEQLDITPPVTKANVTDNWLQTEFTVKLNATDDQSGVAKTLYSLNGTDFVEGTSFILSEKGISKIYFKSFDNAGNVEEVKTAEVKIDTESPVTVSDITTKWYNSAVTVNLSATDDLSGVVKTYYSINGSEFVEGTKFTVSKADINQVSYYSVDNAGNVEEAKIEEIIIDNSPPITKSNIEEKWRNSGFTVNLTASDDLSGVANTFYSINGSEFVEGATFTVTVEGINQVSFYSVDNAGNVETVKTVEVKIDSKAPETDSNITDKWNRGKVTVNLTVTDDLSGVARTFYSINGAEYEEGTSFKVSGEGITKVSFYSVDNAGNIEAVKTVEVKIDTLAPETVSDIEDKWYRGEVTVNLTATDDLSGVAKTFYSINNSVIMEGTTFKVSTEGINKVSFYSVDNAGNVEEVNTVEVKIDYTAPVTESNVVDIWNKEEVTVNLKATDNFSGVAKTFYSLNGKDFSEGTTFKITEEGVNKVYFYSVDNAGNVEVVKTAEVKIDKTAPITVTDIVDKWNKDEVTVNLKAEDNLIGVAKTYYSINSSELVEGTRFTVNKEGINIVTFYSVDVAGNIETVKTAEVKIDKTAPEVSWNQVNEIALGSSLTIDYKAFDSLSGIAKEIVTFNGQAYKNGDIIKFDKPGSYTVVINITDNAGWTRTLEKTFEVYIPANLIVNPGVIKANAGDFTVKINLPGGYNTNLIDLSTAKLNDVSAKSGTNGLIQQSKNGQFKFNRDDFSWSKGTVKVEFRVLLDGYLVVGSTTVEVK